MKQKQILNLSEKELLIKVVKERNVEFLVKWYFNIDLTPTQIILIRRIVFEEHKRFSISAMTRYGKSYCIAIAVGLYIILNKNKRIYFIAPTAEQSMILRDYLSGFIRNCPQLLEITDRTMQQDERLTQQTSKAHQTFSNGCSYRVFTAHDEADSLMGHGIGNEGGMLIIDEACKIKPSAYTKIMRMLGDKPDKTMLIELYNPWDRDSKAYEHSIDPDFCKMHIDWRLALKESRTTQEFIDRQRKEITPIEFEVLYESRFPKQGVDSLFSIKNIRKCIDSYVNFDSNTRIISCDVADKGLDKTVIITGKYNKDDGKYMIDNIYSEGKSENTDVAGRINNIIARDRPLFERIVVNIDTIGIGTGVVSMVKEFVSINRLSVEVNGCHFGEKPIDDKSRFANRKAEEYFRLEKYINDGMIYLLDNRDLNRELAAITWKYTSSNKIIIVDPDKSPDFADALVYFIWKSVKHFGGYIAM